MSYEYRHLIDRPCIVDPRVRVVDYVGLLSENSNQWVAAMSNLIPKSNDNSYRPKNLKITICYSFTRIPYFPVQSLEGEIIDRLKEPFQINPDIDYRYNIFIDPFGSHNLILELNEPSMIDLHQHYIESGASWDFEPFKPHVVIESDTTYTEHDLVNLPWDDKLFELLTFNQIVLSRFGENMDALSL
jgi:hypothetical protein